MNESDENRDGREDTTIISLIGCVVTSTPRSLPALVPSQN